jgi:hypothetical protein
LCGEPGLSDERRDVLPNPTLSVEVLSDSIEAYDRGEISALCRQVPSLREFRLASQKPGRGEPYTRCPDRRWALTDHKKLTTRVPLASVQCTLELAVVYGKVYLRASAERNSDSKY